MSEPLKRLWVKVSSDTMIDPIFLNNIKFLGSIVAVISAFLAINYLADWFFSGFSSRETIVCLLVFLAIIWGLPPLFKKLSTNKQTSCLK